MNLIPKKTWLIILACTVGSFALVVVMALFSPWLEIKDIKVQGAYLSGEENIAGKLEPLKGQRLSQVSDQDVAALLGEEQAVEGVRIAAEPPSSLTVNVLERRPVAVMDKDQQLTLIDKEGNALKVVDSVEQAQLPVIDSGASQESPEVFAALTAVLESLPDEVLSQLDSASARSAAAVELSMKDGKKIIWGSNQENRFKAAVVTVLLQKLPEDPPVTQIDVSAPGSPVTR